MYHLIGRVRFLNVRLLLDAIEIFLQAVQEKQYKFLRILLSVSRKRRPVPADCVFEMFWRERRRTLVINCMEQVSVCFGNVPIMRKWVAWIKVFLIVII